MTTSSSKNLILFILLITFSWACLPYKPPPIEPPLEQIFKTQGSSNFYLEGKIKVKKGNYGFLGEIQLIKISNTIRLDVFTPLDWPLLTVIKKENLFSFFHYQQGHVYTTEKPPNLFKSLLPTGLSFSAWATIVGNQIWLINPDRYKVEEKKDKYFIWLEDKKRYLVEEIWLKKPGLKVEKITLKNGVGLILCSVWFDYNPIGQPIIAKFRDRKATSIEIIYKDITLTSKTDH